MYCYWQKIKSRIKKSFGINAERLFLSPNPFGQKAFGHDVQTDIKKQNKKTTGGKCMQNLKRAPPSGQKMHSN
jgi:hypothetical protein